VPPADRPARPRARSAQLARGLLLAAVAGPLVGLAAPSGGGVAVATATAQPEPMLFSSVAVAPAVVAPPATPVRRTVRATRSRAHSSRWVRPVSAGMNSPYGPRWGAWHPGIDFAAHYGAPIHVVADGTVIGAGYLSGEGGYGQIVLVRHKGGVVTAYAHMSKVLVHAGEHVRAGDTLGKVGATGHVTGPHLHFEVRVGGQKVNPVPWLRRHGVRV
jgi:murein DD-endopeptidase MepM/ murein hydrolase activator NlpD